MKLRRSKYSKRKFAAYIVSLGILLAASFFLNIFFVLQKPLFISPIGKVNQDISYVEKILKENRILFSKVTFSDYFYLVNTQNNGLVYFSYDKDIDKQIASLQKILRELTIEGKLFKSIDFRFSEPIISF